MAARRADIRLYLITDRTQTHGQPLVDVVAAALRGGVDAVQLREKDLTTRELLRLARDLVPLCRRHRARLLINERIDVALAVGADGVHLPAASFSVADARRLVGERMLVGVSTHSVAEVAIAARDGADFVVLGPIYATPSKAAFGAPLGPAALADAARQTALPVLALGGVGMQQITEVIEYGAAGIAVVRAICGATDPERAAMNLQRQLAEVLH